MPLERTIAALDHIVHRGPTLYIGISNYTGEQTHRAAAKLRHLDTPYVVSQS